MFDLRYQVGKSKKEKRLCCAISNEANSVLESLSNNFGISKSEIVEKGISLFSLYKQMKKVEVLDKSELKNYVESI